MRRYTDPNQSTHYLDTSEPSTDVIQSIRDFLPQLRGLHVSTAFMCALVAELPYHKDRATGLAVSIHLTNDFARAAKAFGAASLEIGSLPPEPSSIRGMLHVCAPLAQNGWQIICEMASNRMTFGVAACDQTAASPGSKPSRSPIPEGLQQDGVVTVWEPSRGVIVIQAATGELRFRYGPPTASTEPSAMTSLIVAMTGATGSQDVGELRDRLHGLFSAALATSGGVLIAVVQRTWGGGWPCEDAIFLPKPIDALSLVPDGHADEAGPSSIRISPYSNLVVSMIQSDGIVVFDNAARLRAYRWFVRLTPDELGLPGGARERAFRALNRLIEEGPLVAAFIRSGDGATQFTSARNI